MANSNSIFGSKGLLGFLFGWLASEAYRSFSNRKVDDGKLDGIEVEYEDPPEFKRIPRDCEQVEPLGITINEFVEFLRSEFQRRMILMAGYCQVGYQEQSGYKTTVEYCSRVVTWTGNRSRGPVKVSSKTELWGDPWQMYEQLRRIHGLPPSRTCIGWHESAVATLSKFFGWSKSECELFINAFSKPKAAYQTEEQYIKALLQEALAARGGKGNSPVIVQSAQPDNALMTSGMTIADFCRRVAEHLGEKHKYMDRYAALRFRIHAGRLEYLDDHGFMPQGARPSLDTYYQVSFRAKDGTEIQEIECLTIEGALFQTLWKVGLRLQDIPFEVPKDLVLIRGPIK